MEYEIVFAKSARRELERLQRNIAERILAQVESLSCDVRPYGSVKLKGSKDLWRIRSGDYRTIYRVDDNKLLVDIIAVRHRSNAYRNIWQRGL